MLKRASLALLLLCLPRAAGAADANNPDHWIRDPNSGCALFDASARPGDTVRWDGDCESGRAEGYGTASFANNGAAFESFTGIFSSGTAADGAATVTWGDGWRYDGEMAHGRFDGEGILVNDKKDHFEGLWSSGKLNGMGSVVHPDGERYDGVWKDDVPNGHGILIHADGSSLEGEFRDGQYLQAAPSVAATPVSLDNKQAAPAVKTPSALADLSGKTLLAVDGAALNLTAIEGGIERDISAANGAREKTTFTFINDRLGTIAADGGAGAANVTGFFRLTDNGVEVRYADGRSEILSANADGGVLLRLETPGAPASCRSFYPSGHSFSDAEKKAAVAEYASRLGLSGGGDQPGCAGAMAEAAPLPSSAAPDTRPHAERHTDLKHPAKFSQPKFTSLKGQLGTLETVSVKDSQVHAIDAMPALPATPMADAMAAPLPQAGSPNASNCLKVESDGSHWGFRNACTFAVQFAYCLAQGGDSLTGCAAGGVAGSVAAGSFGALLADKSFSETNAEQDFRWLACPGGAGEVVAHLEKTDPPDGRCVRAGDIASNDGVQR